ncbi:BglG family transcription antiterminator [Neobacillus vireti]|uniref:BigG family transcription antiterminator n=1 Tax=Neobacillus vireti LMG 21834 TaxID=1131730 RepID=A0AB94IN91_9BACI|nr:BglG family transcription antiterminator [Neobacillus vireti]ETI68510.1 BigG family transcription antiterminator [Neobacillus vireti LMG 21834]KLT18068.1 PTS sugar transporter [Neobacillus vireti]
MLSLTKRQKDILQFLTESSEPITAEWIAKEIGISDRTVRKEMKLLQQDSGMLGIEIESIRGKGYQMKVLNSEFLSTKSSLLFEENNQSATFMEQEDRVRYLLKRLLLAPDFIRFETLEEETFVSRSTLQQDLKIVRQMIKKYKLKITNRPHYGTKVEGDEYKKRSCLSNLILRENGDISLKGGPLQLVEGELFEKIKEVLIKKVNDHQINISDVELENLTIHIVIACKRIKEGFIIDPLGVQLGNEHAFEKMVSLEVIKEVETITGLSFPKSEIDYIMVHLLGTKLLTREEVTDFGEFDEVNTLVNCMIEKLRSEFIWDFHNDIEFIKGITLHLRPAMNRLRYGLNMRNPLLNQTKTKFPSAFEGAVVASKCIEDYLNKETGENEIAYIALHIGAALERMKEKQKQAKRVLLVCATGMGSAQLLFYHLQNVFKSDIEIVDTISFYNLTTYNLSGIDFIISTIPIKESLGIPVLVVHTFLEEEDITTIKKELISSKSDQQEYLHPSRIFIHHELDSKEDTIRFLCHELSKQGLVSTDYVELVLERENLASTCFGNLVAIPHPIKPVTNKTFWTVCTLKSPIQWDEQKMVQFVCLLNIKEGDTGNLNYMYQQLIQIIEHKSIVQKLIKSSSKEEIIKTMYEQISDLS